MITFQCDPGFSPVTEMTATCNSSGQWSTDLSQLVCTGSNGECFLKLPINSEHQYFSLISKRVYTLQVLYIMITKTIFL